MNEDPVIQWLLDSEEPAIRYFTLADLLERPGTAPEVIQARADIMEGAWVRALLAGQGSDGGFGVHPYQKWTGAHWRLVSLVELGIPAHEPRACAAADQVLQWLTGKSHRSRIVRLEGLTRRCASQEGNALAVCSRLGLAEDPRVSYLAGALLGWQWPDGGWNCDKQESARHSSFYESLAPLWGLIEYQRASGDEACGEAARQAADFFLRHELFRSEQSGEVIDPEWLRLHYPLYWRYDILQALTVLSRLGPLTDPRAQEALDILEQKRLPDGRWEVEGCYWKLPGGKLTSVDVVDWGRRGPNRMITLNARRALKAAGRQ